MLQRIGVAVCALGLLGLAVPAQAECPGCKAVAEKGEGFCCGKGMAFGVHLTSKKLYEAVSGEELDASKLHCPGCQHAAKTGGTCEHCHVSFAHGKTFHSRIGFILAKGEATTEEEASHCPACKAAFEKNGRCEHCQAGYVAHRVFHNMDDYKAAQHAYAVLVKAAETAEHCDACAVAMVTDGTCEHCNVSFKDGEKL